MRGQAPAQHLARPNANRHGAGARKHFWRYAATVTAVLGLGATQALAFATFLPQRGWDEPADAETTAVRVHFRAPLDDLAVVKAARLSWNQVDREALKNLSDTELVAAHEDLARTLDASCKDDADVLLQGVPVAVLESYQQGEVPLSALLEAAASVENEGLSNEGVRLEAAGSVQSEQKPGEGETQTDTAGAGAAGGKAPEEDSETASGLPDPADAEPVVELSAAVDPADRDQIRQKVENFERSLASLPIEERIQVSGLAGIDVGKLSAKELEAALKVSDAKALRKEAETRFAESLPDFSEEKNGHMPASLLCDIPWNPSYQLACAGIPKLEELNAAFKQQFGYNLPVISGYRSYAHQEAAHAASPNMTTLPGTSNHSWGLAVDFDWDIFVDYDAPEVIWLVENGPTYGWRNPTLESFGTAAPEPWHYEFGTKYTDDPGWGFNGPEPLVPYQIDMPSGWRPQTLLTGSAG